MLTKDDLKQIGEVVDERFVGFDKKMDEKFLKFEERIVPKIVDQIVSQVGEMIEENVLPGFERLENMLVSKNYLDDKLAGLRGEFTQKQRLQ